MKSKILFTALVILAAMLLQGCYINEEVEPDKMGIQIKGGRIEQILGPGIYTDLGFFSDLEQVGVGTVTFSVEDPEVLTSDNQPVGVKITVQARRNAKSESIINLRTNWPSLVKDDSLITTISATAREGIKVGTRDFTLQGLLNDRNGLASKIMDALEGDAEKYSVSIINVTIENIAPSPQFVDLLQRKANYVAETDAELQKQTLIKQQKDNERLQQEREVEVQNQRLLAEQAKTKAEVEIAARQGKIVAAQSEVYTINPQAYELEKLRRLASIFGEKSVFYFLEKGTDISMILNQQGVPQVIPVAPSSATP